jgi:hypothetical protein
MRGRRLFAALAALSVIAAACGEGGSPFTLETTTSAPPATTATTSATSTSPPATATTTTTTGAVTTTTTTTAPATTTTLAPAVPVVGWDGEGVRDLAVQISFDPPIAALDMGSVARHDLALLGLEVTEGSATLMAFALEGNALFDTYGSHGTCYTGARVGGMVTLTAPGRPDLEARLSGEVPTSPVVVLTCEKDADYAPFDDAFEKGLLGVAADFWGPAAAPLLIEVVQREVATSAVDLALKAVAMDEFRALAPGDLLSEHKVAMLEAAIDVVAYLVETEYTPHGADQAARRLLTAYSGTDFGTATTDDVGEWRAWLEGWVAGGGS